jgi:hypothetical protein
MVHGCPQCGHLTTQKLRDTWLVVCSQCNESIPDDWSTIQIGSTGMYKEKTFKITGRVRLQMQNDFRNLWCAIYDDRTLWISQSLESIGFFKTSFDAYPAEFSNPIAGTYIVFSNKIKLKCELVEPCIGVKFEGEIARFPFPEGDFTFIQASNKEGNTMLVAQQNNGNIQFLWGELSLVNAFSFENKREFNDWK